MERERKLSPAFDSGDRLGDPAGDPSREAVASLRGYAYQIYASALAWLALEPREILYLEVAEDYAIAAAGALQGVQVRDTVPSGSITIRSPGIVAAIDGFIDLVLRNPGRNVSLRYLTTSPIGKERSKADRVGGEPSLQYWRSAAAFADVAPLRTILEALPLAPATKSFIAERSNEELKTSLLRRIHWDAGAAPLSELELDLEDGLVEFCGTKLGYRPDVARTLKGVAIEHVLRTSVRPEGRELRLADLMSLAERVGSVSLTREQYERLLSGGGARGPQFVRSGLLLRGEMPDQPLPQVSRRDLIELARHRRANGNMLFVTGSSGLGKTSLAQRIAGDASEDWRFAEFRDLAIADISARLEAIAGELAGSPATSLLLDDIAAPGAASVAAQLERLSRIMRRRDGLILVTCYEPPTPLACTRISGSRDVLVEVPYLTLNEVEELVVASGGRADQASSVFLAASGGHPQLVQAAILHLRSEEWKEAAVAALFSDANSDIAAEKSAARERMVAALPDGAKAMLLRTSLILGRFKRELALRIGELTPAIASPGSELDRLIGPWIEKVESELRVSPLIADAGRQSLGPDEQKRIHQAIADVLLRSSDITVVQADPIFFHASQGGDRRHLMAFAGSVITASAEILKGLALYSPAFLAARLDQPLAPGQAHISALLRLSQLLIAQAGERHDRAAKIWSTLLHETDDMTNSPGIDEVVLAKLLLQPGLAAWMPGWFELLLRLNSLFDTSPRLKKIQADLRKTPGNLGDFLGFLFLQQAMGMGLPRAIRELVEQLASIEPGLRDRLLGASRSAPADFSLWVNQGWLKGSDAPGWDAKEAVADYLAAASLAQGCGETLLALRCHVAAAIVLDEYCSDPDGALAALEEAQRALGESPLLSRARAKIHWRRQDHAQALCLFDESWATRDKSDRIEGAYLAREAAISAAELERWDDAALWFERARESIDDHPLMVPMAIGLKADRAQALFVAGRPGQALDLMSEVLQELRGLDPDSSLQAAHCHRVVRHAILWLQYEADETRDEQTILPPGACSNPSPNLGIRDLPLGHLDLACYLLASIAIKLGVASHLVRDLHSHLVDGPILSFEATLPFKLAERAIATLDASAACDLLIPFASSLVYLKKEKSRMLAGDPKDYVANPDRGEIPQVQLGAAAEGESLSAAENLLLSFGIFAALKSRPDAIASFRDALGEGQAALKGLARVMAGGEAVQQSYRVMLAENIWVAAKAMPCDPTDALVISARFALFVADGQFKPLLAVPLIEWTARCWTQVITNQRFRLKNPSLAVPEIERALSEVGTPFQRIATILLAATPATSASLGEEIFAQLRKWRARETDPGSSNTDQSFQGNDKDAGVT